MKNKVISLFLAATMVLSLCPATVRAQTVSEEFSVKVAEAAETEAVEGTADPKEEPVVTGNEDTAKTDTPQAAEVPEEAEVVGTGKDEKTSVPETAEETVADIYNRIRLPERATAGSAGYDFYAPAEFTLKPGETIKIPTGVRVEMEQDWVLKCYPRSGLGFKYRLQLNNTVGIIDSDYFYSDNEGHIFAKITNDSNEDKTVSLAAGTGFMQGIFVEYGITVDDDTQGVRNGGFGSTTQN